MSFRSAFHCEQRSGAFAILFILFILSNLFILLYNPAYETPICASCLVIFFSCRRTRNCRREPFRAWIWRTLGPDH
jgi:hypothetical protein